MSLRLLYGSSPIALRQQCLKEVVDWTGRWPDRRALVIVPEQAKLDFEQAYLQLAPQGGLLMAEILSFRRLATRLGAEVGRVDPRQLNLAGQAMLLYRLLHEQKENLTRFAHLADKPGFVKELVTVLGDLRRSQISGDQLSGLIDKIDEIALKQKLADLAILQKSYQQAVSTLQLTDLDESVDQLVVLLNDPPPQLESRLNWLSQTAVWVVGFGETRNFTPQEMNVLDALKQRVDSMTITVMADAVPGDALAAEQGQEIFLIGRRAAWSLQRRLHPNAKEKVQPSHSTAVVRLVQSDRPQDQISWLAGEIQNLVRSGAYRYRDINIAVCRPAEDLPRLQVAFKQFSIPLFLDQVRSLSGTALMRTVLGFLDIARDGWTRQPVMRLLRAGLLTKDLSEVDRLENESLARGLFRLEGLLKEYPDLFDPLKHVVRQLKEAPAGAAKIAALRQSLDQIDFSARVGRRIDVLSQAGETESALALAKSWNALADTLDQLERLAGDIPMSLEAFRGLIAAGLDNADTGVLPTALDQVAVGNLARSRQRECKVLFILGADRLSLPPSTAPEGLLKGFDREVLSQHLEHALPNQAQDQIFADAALIHCLFNQPSDQLIIVAPVADPSPYVMRLLEDPTLEKRLLDPLPGIDDARLNAPQPALNRLLQFSREPVADEKTEEAFAALATAVIQKGYPLLQAQQLLQKEDPLRVQIDPDLIEQRFGQDLYLSVSQLEKYAQCPFRHLAAYGFKLKEREGFEPEASDAGSLLHWIAEQSLVILRAQIDAGHTPEQAARLIQAWIEGELNKVLDGILQQARLQPDLKPFFAPGQQASIGRRLERVARLSLSALLTQLLEQDYRPSAFEWTFDRASHNALKIDLDPSHQVVLNGKIDRVDQLESADDPAFRIIDYKSGNQKVNYEQLYHGLALQLPAYLIAYAQSHPGLKAADACYFHFDDPVFNQKQDRAMTPEKLALKLQSHFSLRSLGLDASQLAFLQAHVTGQIRKWANLIRQGDFSAYPRQISKEKKACEFCAYQAVCGSDFKAQNCQRLAPLGSTDETGKKISKKNDFISRLKGDMPHGAD